MSTQNADAVREQIADLITSHGMRDPVAVAEFVRGTIAFAGQHGLRAWKDSPTQFMNARQSLERFLDGENITRWAYEAFVSYLVELSRPVAVFAETEQEAAVGDAVGSVVNFTTMEREPVFVPTNRDRVGELLIQLDEIDRMHLDLSRQVAELGQEQRRLKGMVSNLMSRMS